MATCTERHPDFGSCIRTDNHTRHRNPSGAWEAPLKPAQIRRHDTNVRHIEANYAPGIVASNFPSDVLFEGRPRTIDRLVQEADEQHKTVRAAWNWLREVMTVDEAIAWLDA